MRIIVKELKKFLEEKPDDAYVFVDTYDGDHHKEFLFVREYENGKSKDVEIQIAKTELSDEV